ncbi:MAG: hypothetical protein KF758_17045 [Anaerolineales bacterium]|nr:hypothetical protein [Anaerolineales bacterium]
MRELFNIFKDIKSGALPLIELPSFMVWAVRKSRHVFMFTLVVAALVLWMKDKISK